MWAVPAATSAPASLARRRRGDLVRPATALMSSPDDFVVGRFLGSYGFMNITSYSSLPSSGLSSNLGGIQEAAREYSPEDIERMRAQDIGEGQVKIRLYEGLVARGPLKGTKAVFKVYPGVRAGGLEADAMAANELSVHASIQDDASNICQNIQFLLGAFETRMGEQWLAFRNDGSHSAADYAKIASQSAVDESRKRRLWSAFDREIMLNRRRLFVLKLLKGALSGLAYMHDHDRLHQSLGPSSVTLNTVMERDTRVLVPRLRDLAFSVDIRLPSIGTGLLSQGLWRRASAAGALTMLEKRAYGIADDIYEAGFLLAYMAFVPFSEPGAMDGISLQRLLESTFRLDVYAAREFFVADDGLAEAVNFLDLGNGAGWELLQAMLHPDYRRRPIAAAVANHRFISGAVSDNASS